jgi:N-acyl homoserine lactone hydrolase
VTGRLVSTPGHTPGHQSVVLRTGHREVLVAGDAAYTARGLNGGPLPLIVADEHVYRRSQKEILRYLEQTPDALAILSHDYEAWPSLSSVYD